MDNQSPVPVGTPISSPPPPQPVTPQIFQPQDVHANVDVSVVPRENGWVQTAPIDPTTLGSTDVVSPVVVPAPQPVTPPIAAEETLIVPEPDVVAEKPVANEDKPAKGDEDKSPLEILEEILANAGEEKAEQEKEAATKKAAADQEKAAMAAKEAQFKEEAAQKIAAITPELQAAQQKRDDVDAQHPEAKSDQLTADLTINQLRHETTTKSE